MGVLGGTIQTGIQHGSGCRLQPGSAFALPRCNRPRRSSLRGGKRAILIVRAEDNPAGEKYDYILVGGGTAGCVLANRLTADSSKKVLVLEAGKDNKSFKIKAPAALTRLFKSVFDWNMYSRNQDDLQERQLYLARGKVLGGSSSTNATLYMRGTRADYDAWGVPEWSSQRALQGFIRCEDNDNGAKDDVHGVGGPMHVENPRYVNPLHDYFFKGADQAGLKKNDNFNDWGHKQEGYGEFQVCQERGVRADAYRQYLKPVQDRQNLTVLTGSRTLKVAFENSRGQPVAKGVVFQQAGPDGEKHTAELKPGGEVIMCAGAVHTPHILQLSGVGNGEELAKHDISVRSGLAGVGENLQDHPACLAAYISKQAFQGKSITDHLTDRRGRVRVTAALNWLLRGKGPLASTGCDHGALVNTKGAGNQPDLQLRFVPAASVTADGVNAYHKLGQLQDEGKPWPSGWTIQVLSVRAKSKGKVGLRSDDPYDHPRLDPRYLTDPEGADLATLRNGVKLARKISQTPAMQEVTERELHPGLDCQTDEALETFIRANLHSGNALVGTCAIGLNPEKGAVVDANLKVYGVQNLRVADSSVIPVIPGGQTGAATVMVAERAAEILLAKAPTQDVGKSPQLALA